MIDNNDIARLDEIYVRKDDCTGYRAGEEKEFREMSERIIEIKTKQNITIGILSAIGVAVLTIAVKVLFGG